MKALLRHITAASALAFVTPLLHASTSGIFKYRLTNIPSSYGHCATIKDSVMNALSHAAAIKIVGTNCETSNDGSVVEVTYSTDSGQPVSLVSTRDLKAEDVDGRGYIATLQICEQRKNELVAKFEQATGLTPFWVYCMKDKSFDMSSTPWHVAIDAIGDSPLHYSFSSRLFSSRIAGDRDAFLAQVANYFMSRPDTVFVDARFRVDSTHMERLVISTFTNSRVRLGIQDSVNVKKTANCGDEARELGVSATRAGLRFIASGCKQHSITGTNVPFIMFEGTERNFLSITDTGITFESMDACKSSREETFRHLQNVVGASVVGVLCDESESKVRAFAIEKSVARKN